MGGDRFVSLDFALPDPTDLVQGAYDIFRPKWLYKAINRLGTTIVPGALSKIPDLTKYNLPLPKMCSGCTVLERCDRRVQRVFTSYNKNMIVYDMDVYPDISNTD